MIRVGVVGYGYWGPNLVRNLTDQMQMKLTHVCDESAERLKLVRHQYPWVKVTTKFEDLLISGIDALVIATPTLTHEKFVEAALNAGKHVLVEKPFVTSSRASIRLTELARKKKCILMVDHVFLYTPAVRKIKQICDRKELGGIIYFDAVRTNLGLFQRDVNVIWDLASHDMSIMLYCLKQKPRAVATHGLSNFKNGLESIVYMTMFFDTNTIAHFHFSWLSPVKVRTILIGGDKKMILYDDTQPSEKVKIYDKGVDTASKSGLHDLLVSYRSGDVVVPKLENTEALKLVCEDFVQSILKKRPPLSDACFSSDIVHILESAQTSLRKGGVRVPIRL